MRRRDFIKVLAGSAVTWPLGARAQQQPMPMIGFLSSASPNSFADRLHAFLEGLNETGYVDGQSVRIVYRWPSDQHDQLPTLASDLVRDQASVIVAAGNAAARAAKKATATTPIIFHTGDDPIAIGLVSTLSRPLGNVTGISAMAGTLPTKRLELVHELVPPQSACW